MTSLLSQAKQKSQSKLHKPSRRSLLDVLDAGIPETKASDVVMPKAATPDVTTPEVKTPDVAMSQDTTSAVETKPKRSLLDILDGVEPEAKPRSLMETLDTAEATSAPKTPEAIAAAESNEPYVFERSFDNTRKAIKKFSLRSRNKTIEVMSRLGKKVAQIPGVAPMLGLLAKATDIYVKAPEDALNNLLTGLHSPAGEKLASSALYLLQNMPAPLMSGTMISPIEKLNLPKKFDKIPTGAKYSPGVIALVKACGADPSELQDRLAVALGVECLIGMGAESLLSAGKLTPKAINRALEMSEESRGILAREMRHAAEKIPPSGAKQLTDKKSLEILRTNTTSSTLSPTDATVNGIKYKINGQGAKAYRVASYEDEVAAVMRNDLEIQAAKPPKDVQEILPEPGEWQFGAKDFDKKGWWLTISSPHRYAPNVDKVIGSLERFEATAMRTMWKDMAPFEKMMGTEQARLVGAVADGLPAAEKILADGMLNDDGLKMLQAVRRMGDKIADAEGIPREKRMLDYLYHVWTDVKKTNKQLDPEMTSWVKEWEPFTKKRTNAPDYILDAVKAMKSRVLHSARALAIKKYKRPIVEAVHELKAINQDAGDMAWAAVKNYFGVLYKDDKVLRRLNQGLKSRFIRGTLFWNFRTPIRNLTQPWTLGVQEIGLGPMQKGAKMMSEIQRGTSLGKRLKQFMNDTGLFVNKSRHELMGGEPGVLQKLAEVPLGKKGAKYLFERGADWQQWSEEFNKSIVYLGRYTDVSRKLKRVKTAGIGKLPRAERWLKLRGINPAGDISTEASNAARRAAIKTQFDYTRWGQTALTRNPSLGPYLVYTTWPLKANEYMLNNAKAALKMITKNPALALQMPETRASLRWGMQLLFSKAMMATTGVSIFSLTGLHGVSESPLLSLMGKTLNAMEGVSSLDPRSVEDIVRFTSTVCGVPITSPVWRIKEVLRVVLDNKDTKGDWHVKNRYSGNTMYKVNPMAFFWTALTGIGLPETQEGFHKLMGRKAAASVRSKALTHLLDDESAIAGGMQKLIGRQRVRKWLKESKHEQRDIHKELKRSQK